MKLIDILRKLGILRFGSVGGVFKTYKEMPDELMYQDVYDKKKDLMSPEDYKKLGETISKATGISVPAGLGAKIFFWIAMVIGVFFLLFSLLIIGFSLWFWLILITWILVYLMMKKYLERKLPLLFTLGMFLFLFIVAFIFLAIGTPTTTKTPSSTTPPPAEKPAPTEKKR